MDNQVEEIKAKIDIVDLIQTYLPLKKRGRNFWANCPFHSEKTPSFTVSSDLQIFKCFGCGKSGDVFTFLEEYEKIDFREALEELAKRAGVTLKASPEVSQAAKISQKILAINHFTAAFYHHMLLHHPLGKVALDYLRDRDITDATIKLFKIGFSPQDSRLLQNFLKKKGFSQQDILETGTFGQKGSFVYDRFHQRLTFPLIDHRDRIVAFSGRVLPGNTLDVGKYINSPETPLYHKGHMFFGLNLSHKIIRDLDQVIVVEGEFDLISPYQAGFKNIVALKGTAFTQDQLNLLKRYTTNLVLCLDSDFAGANAARKSIQMADAMGFDIRVVDLGDYKDPDDAIKADPKFFQQRLKTANSIWDFIINSALKSFDSSTDRGKKQILDYTFPFLTQINNLVIRSTYLTKLAQMLGVDNQALFQEAAKYSKSTQTAKPVIKLPTQTDYSSPLATLKLQHYLTVLIFSHPTPHLLLDKIPDHLDALTLPQFQKLVTALQNYHRKTFSASKFIKLLPAESLQLFQDVYLESQNESIDESALLKQIAKTANNIKLTHYKAKQRQLAQKIAQAELAKDKSSLKKLQTAYNKLLVKISVIQ